MRLTEGKGRVLGVRVCMYGGEGKEGKRQNKGKRAQGEKGKRRRKDTFGRWCPPIDSQGAQVMPEAEELSVRPATHARTQMHSKCLAAACPHA